MKKRILLALSLLPLALLLSKASYAQDGKTLTPEEPMTNARLDRILRTLEPNVKGGNGQWQMVRDGIPVMILTDESHNRMRVIAPAAFIHPLDSLRERDLISAFQQVVTLVKTTGTTYSSSELQFGPSYQQK